MQARPDPTENHVFQLRTFDDEPGNHDVIAGRDESASRDIRSMAGGRIKIVNCYQSHARGPVCAGNNRRVTAGIESGQNRRFQIISWRESSLRNLVLLGIFPVIVRKNQVAVSIVQTNHRIGNRIRHAKVSQRRSVNSHKNGLRLIGYDKSGDKNIVTGSNQASCGNVGEAGIPSDRWWIGRRAIQ